MLVLTSLLQFELITIFWRHCQVIILPLSISFLISFQFHFQFHFFQVIVPIYYWLATSSNFTLFAHLAYLGFVLFRVVSGLMYALLGAGARLLGFIPSGSLLFIASAFIFSLFIFFFFLKSHLFSFFQS